MKDLNEFELFLTRKYNGGELTASEYCKLNLLLEEFEQEKENGSTK